MEPLLRTVGRLAGDSAERQLARRHLNAAKQQDRHAYLALTANYLDLVLAFLATTRSEPPATRLARAEQLCLGLWQHLRYAKRLSDFEYMLADALIATDADQNCLASPEPLVNRLRRLPAQERFALLASEFGGWKERWLALTLRTRSEQLHRLLSIARCELCGIPWNSLSTEERECLEAVSSALDHSADLRANQALCRRCREYPRVLEIKAHWLELRPALVEVRHRYLPSPNQREHLFSALLQGVDRLPMQRPRLVDRMVNTVHFSRHARIRVS